MEQNAFAIFCIPLLVVKAPGSNMNYICETYIEILVMAEDAM